MTTVVDLYGVKVPALAKYKKQATCINPDLVVGFELETERCEHKDEEAWERGARVFNYQVKTDGSLRGVAYEFISRPMRSADALAATAEFLHWAEFTDENYSDRCSIHVHVNCTDLEMSHIASLALLYTLAEETIFEFVGNDRDNNIYCIPWNQCRQHFDLVYGMLNNPSQTLKRWSKYTALNILPLSTLGTVEFRQMHGTADMEKITTWVNIIGALTKMAKQVPLNELIEEIKLLNTNSQYEAFFNRMFGGQLPYTDAYKEKMEAGVIFAKYSLISMVSKKPPAKNNYYTVEIPAMEPMDLEANPAVNQRIQIAPHGVLARAAAAAPRRAAEVRRDNVAIGELLAQMQRTNN